MKLIWSEESWDDYPYWQKADRRVVKKVNELIKDTRRTPFEGKGKLEPLEHNLSGFWPQRIIKEHRLVYTVTDDSLLIAACRYHYGTDSFIERIVSSDTLA